MVRYLTVMFLPKKDGRRGEGGLRTKGIFKKTLPNKPLITVITVVFNGEKTLKQTINSVINQSYDNIEYIIIDGGSADSTCRIIGQYGDKIDYWVSENDAGIYNAINKGISVATGEIVGIIHSNDWYQNNTIEIIAREFQKNQVAVFFGDMIYIRGDQPLFTSRFNGNWQSLKKGMIINHPTVFVPRNIYKKCGKFSESYAVAGDWELMIRFYKCGVNFKYINVTLASFRVGGISSDYNYNTIKEKNAIRKKHNIYRFIDRHYVFDILKMFCLGRKTFNISILRQKIFSKK